MARLKVAVIGTGMIANAAHIPAWKNLKDDVEVMAVSDIFPERAEGTAKRHGIPRAYGDGYKMLQEVQPDIVSVCTPNCYHKEWTIAALEAGAHVLCEKPIAPGYADAVEMFQTADRVNRILMVGQSARFSADTLAAKDIADAGELGEMYYAETASLRRRGVPQWGMFHMKEHNAGGPIYDLGVHALDALLWIMGNPKVVAVSGQTYTKLANQDEGLKTSLADSGAPLGVFDVRPYDYREFDVEDMAAGFLRLETGATVSIKTSWAANIPEGMGGTFILGTRGGLRMRPLTLIRNLGSYQVDVIPKVPQDPNIAFYGHWKETAHMLNVIRGEEEMMIKREEVLNVIRALDGLYQSALEGREVCLD
ncbi:MAG TPA: Gfo/Idh/MocA family oxidoreductase [Chloroflexi bacterium]|jgi:predicted dehydrogenase|nr:Gfo/Idh/MocA family oxidoreductase [Chloroflexota bacterium]